MFPHLDARVITILLVLAVLVLFLSFLTIVKYAVHSNFKRTRLIMTAFLFFIVATLSISFWQYALQSLYFTIPAFLIGALLGYNIGVHTERQKIAAQGIAHYIDHFLHISKHDLEAMTWWSIVNFYSIMGGLVLINMVGLSMFIFPGHESLAIVTAVIGAFLIGTMVPYIGHLWSVKHETI